MDRRHFIRSAGVTGGAAVLNALSPFFGSAECAEAPRHGDVDLAPATWTAADRTRYQELELVFNGPHPAALGTRGMVAGTSNPFAIHAGVVALQQSGSAADAALCTALTQVALMFGAATSYAGALNALYYQASTGRVYALEACFNTVKDETDPLTIPPFGTPSGRSVLVPGFMAGAQALHDRFGNIPFVKLFDPAIWVAENGVRANAFFTRPFAAQERFVTRLAAGKEVFLGSDGKTLSGGGLFRQPRLAKTLATVAQHGAEYMYRGDWARQFVDAVQNEGGKLTLKDLADYRVNWTEPLEGPYGEYRITSLPAPNYGGAITLVAMNLLAAADLKRFGHYTTSGEAFYWSVQISRLATMLVNRPADSFGDHFPGIDLSRESLLTSETAGRIWERMQQPDWNLTMKGLQGFEPATTHSAAVLAVDADGNVASVVHSINSIGWGCSGIFVGGVSISDSACIQQGNVAKAGPGMKLPGPANPVIVLNGHKPCLASAAIGSGLHPVTIQNLTNVLDFQMDPKQSVDTPNFMGPYFGLQLAGPAQPELQKEAIVEGDFSNDLIHRVRELGQEVKAVDKQLNRPQRGYWIGVRIDEQPRKLLGGVTPELNARAEGY